MALQVVDRTMQAFGAEGLSQDQDLAFAFANLRTLRIADVSCIGLVAITLTLMPTLQGPDAVCFDSQGKCSLVLIILVSGPYTAGRTAGIKEGTRSGQKSCRD